MNASLSLVADLRKRLDFLVYRSFLVEGFRVLVSFERRELLLRISMSLNFICLGELLLELTSYWNNIEVKE